MLLIKSEFLYNGVTPPSTRRTGMAWYMITLCNLSQVSAARFYRMLLQQLEVPSLPKQTPNRKLRLISATINCHKYKIV